MHSLAKHRGRTCLSSDDLEGLHVLYPLCETDGIGSHPLCVSRNAFEPRDETVPRRCRYMRILLVESLSSL